MSLVVEDGTSKSDAESYVSVVDADAYHSARGFTIWDNLSPTEKEQALTRATDYMIGEYRTRWSGSRVLATQALDWPRNKVYVDDLGATSAAQLYPANVVPTEVKRACCALALRASAGELVSDAGPQIIEDTIGPITTKWKESSTTPKIKYIEIDNMLKPFLQNGSTNFTVKLVRG